MQDVLLVCQDIPLENAQSQGEEPVSSITMSLEEKTDVQAIENTADLPPQPGTHSVRSWGHEYERVRHGALSLLAALDLNGGQIVAQVHARNRSREHILLLKELDAKYPPPSTIRVILDNHRSHVSKETMACLATRPDRFIYVHTPKHGSWLNLIETVFLKMARSFLNGVRVGSRAELKQCILQGVNEMNRWPVVICWRKFDLALA
jgi:transposase